MRRLLVRHLVVEVLLGVALVTGVLLAIDTFVSLVGQLNDIGGDYGVAQAIAFVALEIPGTIVAFLPASALLGALLALGNLAVHRELVVMRATGMSPLQLLGAVAVAGCALVVVMVLLGETMAPKMGAYARAMRTHALHNDVELGSGVFTWLKAGDHILAFHKQEDALEYNGGVLILKLGPGQTLDRIAHADSAEVGLDNDWVLSHYTETTFTADGVTTSSTPRVAKRYGLSPDLLDLAVVRADLLSTAGLERYIAYLRANGLDASRYLIAYWLRASNVVSVLLMTILALPFVFGGLRSGSNTRRLLVGLIVGLVYYVATQMLAHSGEVFRVDPRIVAWVPPGILVLVIGATMWRWRRPG